MSPEQKRALDTLLEPKPSKHPSMEAHHQAKSHAQAITRKPYKRGEKVFLDNVASRRSRSGVAVAAGLRS